MTLIFGIFIVLYTEQFERVQVIRSMRRLQHSRADSVMGACNQYPLGEKLRCPYCGSRLYQRALKIQRVYSPGWCCERGENACHGFVIRSNLVEKALLEAYKNLDLDAVRQRLSDPEWQGEAEKLLKIKAEHPAFDNVDYWWVDDLIDYIGFGQHSQTQREHLRMVALGLENTDDRIIDQKTWDAVQLKVQQEKKENRDGNVHYHGGRTHFLYGKVFCGCYASPYIRRTFRKSSRKDNKETYKIWVCREQKNGIAENGCSMRKIRETELLAVISEKMGYDLGAGFPVERFLQEVEKVLIGERGVQVVRK